ncbi:MFS transporter [Kineococcus rhizosphaerae]|uniref:EmrB/QacA subfamily drug resistance transporter n=1 Tax=Kineococcus rhizosphaerae TaxID=559628 RepID=A0A2T0R867_9ACTN|nr:MFS transporter [Kineococcus rhizosphaerae]PRY17348.1 EmrB/QacA subfamily drug resistance transporter [Kineococcus rhizosphaerae]
MAAAGDGIAYASPAGRWVLLTTILGSGLASLDASVVNVALPTIGRDLDVDLTALQGVVTAYTLTLAGLLLLGGSLGDRFGRRRVFCLGVAWFALASLLCGLAPGAGTLVAARALQGVGAALLTPGSLAILEASFRPADRARAIGAWSGLGGVATALGPLLGGWLLQVASWRWLFLLNVPLAVVVLVVAARHVPETRAPGAHGRVDWPGAVLVTAALAAATSGLVGAGATGWASGSVLVPLVLGVVLLGAFLLRQARARDPLLPLDLFRRRQFSGVNAVTFVVYGALSATLFLLPVVLQDGAGYSPLAAGATLLPVTLVMLLLSARSGALAARRGPRLQLSAGPVVVAAGLLLLVRVDQRGDYLTQVLPAVLVFGLGLAVTVAPLTSTALAAAPVEHAGVASATNNVVARTAGLLSVAVLPALVGLDASRALPPAALVAGLHTAAVLAAGVCVLGGVLAALTIRDPGRAPTAPACSHCAVDAPALRP